MILFASGTNPPMCLDAELEKNKAYILTLERLGDELRPLDTIPVDETNIVAVQSLLTNISRICGTDVRSPIGL